MKVNKLSAIGIGILLVLSLLGNVWLEGVWQIKPARATTIFGDGFESGYTSWTSTTEHYYATLAINSTIVHSGVNSSKTTSTGVTADYAFCSETIPGATTYFMGERIYVSALPDVVDSGFSVMVLTSAGYGAAVEIINSSGGLIWSISYHDAGGWQLANSTVATINPAQWYFPEVKVVSADSVGELRLYVDDVEVITKTGLNINWGDLVTAHAGVYGTVGNAINAYDLYVDDVVVSTTFIESIVSPLSVSLNSPTSGSSSLNQSIDFIFTPVTHGSNIQNATLWTNVSGSWGATQGNTTAIVNNTQNTISYMAWPSYSTFVWNIQVYNTTTNVFAASNYTFTIVATPPSLSTSLVTPPSGSTLQNTTINFVYAPLTYGTALQNATLWTNVTGSWASTQSNTTVVLNNTQNTISYSAWSTYSVIVWNIQVFNTTASVFASANYTIILTANTGLLPYSNNWVSASQMRGIGLGPQDISAATNWTLMAKTLASYGINFFSIGGFSNHNTVYQSVYPNIPCEFDPPVNYTEMINAFHSYGIKVVAGVTAMLGSYSGDSIDRNSYWTNTNISGITEYPYSGGWLDIANPASTALLYNLTTELVSNYSIDCMTFDYLRWDDWLMPLGNYDMADFQAQTGLDVGANYSTWLQDVLPVYYPYTSTLTGGNGKYWSQFLEWRCNLVTRLLQNITQWALAINPNLIFGCTPHAIPSDSAPDQWPVQQGQDPANWVRLGLIQWLAPMHYPSDGSNATVDAYIADLPNVIHRHQNFVTGGAHGQVALMLCITDGGAGWGFNVSSDRMVTWINTMIASGADGWLLLGYGGPGTPPTSGDPNSTVIFDGLGLPNPVTFALANITATALSGTSEQISWTTSSAVNSIVQYNPNPLFVWSQLNATDMIASGFPYWQNNHTEYYIASNSTVDTNHAITLVELTPDITYYFRVMSVDASGTAFSPQLEFTGGGPTITVTVTSPTNTTYTTSTIPVQISASDGTIVWIGWNCKNGTSWIYGSNQTYTAPTSMTGFVNGASYTFYGFANNTLGDTSYSTVMFTVDTTAWANGTTYTCRGHAKDVYISGGVVISVEVNGIIVFATTNVMVHLEPAWTIRIVWTVAPTIKVFGE